MHSENIVLKNLCNIAKQNPSRIDDNLRFIFHKYCLNYKRVYMYKERDICNSIVNKWKEYIKQDLR